MDRLDYETANNFLKKIGVSCGIDIREKDPLSFLRHIARKYQEHVPFQCVSMIAQEKEEKHVPTIEEVIEAGLSLEGGLCFTLNIFMCMLLRGLKFKAEVVNGCFSVLGDTHDHVIVLVKDLRFHGDDYIIDVGNGFPFEGPVAVSELPKTCFYGGHKYRYEEHNDLILRLHRLGDDIDGDEDVLMHGEWSQFFHFDLKPVTFDFFYPYMKNIYEDDVKCDFHWILRAVRFPPSDKNGSDDPILLAIRNQSLLVGPMDNAQKSKIAVDGLANKLKENFPNIPPAKIDRAVKNWVGLEEKRNKK